VTDKLFVWPDAVLTNEQKSITRWTFSLLHPLTNHWKKWRHSLYVCWLSDKLWKSFNCL